MLSYASDICANGETPQNQPRCLSPATPDDSVSEGVSKVCREGCSHSARNISSSTVLQSPTEIDKFFTIIRFLPINSNREIQCTSTPSSGGKSRPHVMGSICQGGSGEPHLFPVMRISIESDASNFGVGGHEWSGLNRGVMVRCGISTPHKLSGTTSSIPSTQNICKRSESLHCPSQVRQYFGSDLHQSEKGSSHQAAVQLGNRNLGVVSDPQNHFGGRTPSWDSQHDRRPGVKNNLRLLRLDAKSINFSGHPRATGSTGGGSFCIPPDKTITVLQLPTGSRCGSDRCFYSELGSEQRFCKPSLVLDQPLLM